MRQKLDTVLNHEEDMTKDTRYLRCKDGNWHFDYKLPANFKRFFSTDRIRHALNTADYKQAKYLRDKYLLPALSAKTIYELLENLFTAIKQSEIDLAECSSELASFLKRDSGEHRLSLESLFLRFITAYKTGGFSEATVVKQESSMNAFLTIIGKDMAADDVDRQTVVLFRDSLLSMPVNWQTRKKSVPEGEQTRTLSPKTVSQHLDNIKRVFSWGISDGLLHMTANPVQGIEVIQSAREIHKRPPTSAEADLLCRLPFPRTDTINEFAWKYLPVFGRYTGCRIGELSQLTVDDIIIKNDVRCLRITAFGEGKRLKTESSERLVPVSDKLSIYLDEVLSMVKKGMLFPECGHLYSANGKDIYKAAHAYLKLYNRAAKKVAPDQSYHCWRVYGNSQMADAGVDILDREAILGHKSDRMQKAYTADNLKRWKSAVDKIV